MSAPNSSVIALTTVFKEELTKAVDSLKEHMIIQNQETLVQLKELKNMLVIMQKTTSAPKAPKAKATAAADATPSSEAAPAASTAAKSEVSNNILVWFKKRYVEDEEFRKRVVSEDIRKKLDADESLKKATPEARVKSESGKAWALINEAHEQHTDKTTKSMRTQLKEEHDKAKQAVVVEQPQQTVEPNSP